MKKNIILLSFVIGVYACSTVAITGRKQLSLVSDEEITSLSLQEYGEFMKTAQKSTDKVNTALVVKVGTNLATAINAYYGAIGQESPAKDYQWEFNLVKDEQVNAFCMPGGKIVVYEGILPYTQTETGLAVVLGHEIAHAIAKHSNERVSQQVAAQYGQQLLGVATSGQSEVVQTAIGAAYGLGAQYGVLLPFSRKQELEADHLGLIFMAIAGYSPNDAVSFWQRMSQQGSATPEFMSTHPSDATRIAKISEALPEALKYYKK
ncbi:MAG: M48 family metallopeptidase [Prevotellaceae bacterium]|jgi:predicted Zn-dependent protease|nr:M48 family metallopeptidase [Prevotellaceae bacterium]